MNGSTFLMSKCRENEWKSLRFVLQAFENYQVQPMTNEFLESFGYDEAIVDDTEHLKYAELIFYFTIIICFNHS